MLRAVYFVHTKMQWVIRSIFGAKRRYIFLN